MHCFCPPIIHKPSSLNIRVSDGMSYPYYPVSYFFLFREDETHTTSTSSQTDPDFMVQVITLTAVNTTQKLLISGLIMPAPVQRGLIQTIEEMQRQMAQQTHHLQVISQQLRIQNIHHHLNSIVDPELMSGRESD